MILFITVIIASLLCAVGCTTDTTDSTAYPSEDGGVTSIAISLERSRIALGEKENGTYPVAWSEGDKIVVNGILSEEVEINSDDRSRAIFMVNGSLSTPYRITYPYCSNSTAGTPKVVVPAEQAYTEGTFAPESTPMCGYAEKKNSTIALKHLCGVLRFPVVGGREGVVLDKIVITSTNGTQLAGEFDVDCANATISVSDNGVNSITYSLPNNFTLSTSEESVFYISVPAVNAGICKVEFFEQSGERMTRYWDSKVVTKGNVREFKTITYKQGVGGALTPLGVEEDDIAIYYTTIWGYVKDSNGNPISGVAVSDGFEVVVTDANGFYSINNVTPDTWYIYISVPAEYEIPINEYGQPCFYKPYPSNTDQYDFTLTPLKGGKEEKFALFAIGDPQVCNAAQLKRFKNEAAPGLLTHCQEVKAQGLPCYAITLGDLIGNGGSANTTWLRDDMRDGFHIDKIGMPVFHTFGNHDSNYFSATQPLIADSRSSSFELKAQREHEDMFGPINYSFDRGDIHIVSMRNILYRHIDDTDKYSEGFLFSQYLWLKQDLALVPKDKMVILCVHAPIFGGTSNYVANVMAMLNQFNEAHILSGHTHFSQNYEHIIENPNTLYPKLYEHNVGALCGVWWRGNIAGDGAPCGYNVFIVEKNKFIESYTMGFNEGLNNKEKQMRLYRGNAITGRDIKEGESYNPIGYYAFNFGDDVLLANIYNGDKRWKIKVYEDGEYTGDMEHVMHSGGKPEASSMIGEWTYDNPRRLEQGNYAIDMYAAGFYYAFYAGRSAWYTCHHLYKYTLKNKDAQNIRVEATDRYGKVFTETEITEGTDYSLVKRP